MQRGVYKLYKLSPRVNIRANMIAQVECVTLGLALASSTEPAGADFLLFFSMHYYWVICTGISDSVHLLASMGSETRDWS